MTQQRRDLHREHKFQNNLNTAKKMRIPASRHCARIKAEMQNLRSKLDINNDATTTVLETAKKQVFGPVHVRVRSTISCKLAE
jgi:hypothetical protein